MRIIIGTVALTCLLSLPLSAISERNLNIARFEMNAFSLAIGDDHFATKQVEYKGQQYTLYLNMKDPEVAKKAKAVKKAVKTLVDKGIVIPANLTFYLTNNISAQNRAFERDEGWNEIAIITLGSHAIKGGREDALSATGNFFMPKASITSIHEIGHILHERNAGELFWDKAFRASTPLSAQVSGYATMNIKEFVAEVFAGTIIGRRFPPAVYTEYERLQGPTLPMLRR